jgi:hypothetical protein
MKNQDNNYYLRKNIELTEENKKTIIIDSSIIYDFPNDNELGKEIRRLITKKLDHCNEYIEQVNNLIKERS